MTKEEQEQMLRNRGSMIGAAQGPLTLGGAVPAFPTNFQNINPQPAAPLIPFRGGGTAEMSVGGAQVNYPSRLGLAGGDYGTRFQFGAEEFGPARLPQESTNMLEQQYTNPSLTPSERMGETLTRGLTPVAPQESTSITEGPVRMGIAGTQTAIQRGLQPIQTPRGTLYATEQQASDIMTPRTLAQQGTRTPAEQQAMLAQMREQGSAIRQRLAGEEATRQQGLRQRYYAFRQGLSERQAQEALSTERGRSPEVMRGAQAMVEAERWKQAQAGRSPMSREPLAVRGMQFRQTSMGQYTPVAGFGDDWMKNFVGGGPQPASSTAAPTTTTVTPPNFQTDVLGFAPITRERRRRAASMARSRIGRGLAIGGFGNPMLYNPPTQRRSGVII